MRHSGRDITTEMSSISSSTRSAGRSTGCCVGCLSVMLPANWERIHHHQSQRVSIAAAAAAAAASWCVSLCTHRVVKHSDQHITAAPPTTLVYSQSHQFSWCVISAAKNWFPVRRLTFDTRLQLWYPRVDYIFFILSAIHHKIIKQHKSTTVPKSKQK